MTHMKDATVAAKPKALRRPLSSYRPLLAVLYVSLLPVIQMRDMLLAVWRSGLPRAWDGTGHYGITQIYADTIFPDTFGWTAAHFGGMPFPNFYPPLFFWGVALLRETRLFSLLTAFKLFVLIPLLLIPASIYLLGWAVSNKQHAVAFWAALVSVIPLVSPGFAGQRVWASGLEYFSTLSIGMYTQPLGFVLLLAWYAAYGDKSHRRVWLLTVSSLLLSLAVLANFLNGMMATLIISSTLLFDVLRYRRLPAGEGKARAEARGALLAHAASPLLSAGLALFWLVPMLSTYEYFVTRPFTRVILTPEMMIWFVLAGAGVLCWYRRPTRAMGPHIVTCLFLAAILIFTASAAPRWMPLQANRFTPTFIYLLSVPVAFCLSSVYRAAAGRLAKTFPRRKASAVRLLPYAAGLLLALPVIYCSAFPLSQNIKYLYRYQAMLAFYPSESVSPGASAAHTAASPSGSSALPSGLSELRPADVSRTALLDTLRQEHQDDVAIVNQAAATLHQILRFGQEHRDGRYLVEIPSQYRIDAAAFDGRALNSYLGAQGNQTLTVVFREASPNSIFMFPQDGALSYNPDNFGFSSVLGDDLDFVEQPLARHLERVRLLGARYLVINSEAMKERLSREPLIAARYDCGAWSIFALREEPPPLARPLPYRPALLVSDFTLKGRRDNERNFVRFAEEQFADGWFDVLLVRSPTTRLDDLGTLNDLTQFGAIILDTYDCRQCDIVYRQLKDFSRSRPLILLMNDSDLCNRIRYSLGDFPMARVVERVPDNAPGFWLDNLGATHRYLTSPLRQEWAQIRRILEENEIPSEPAVVSSESRQGEIQIDYHAQSGPTALGVPVLISASYHPNWQSEPSEKIYAANPMFMLTFLRQPTRLTFRRGWLDRLGLGASACTLVALLGFNLWFYRGRFGRIIRRKRGAARRGERDERLKTEGVL